MHGEYSGGYKPYLCPVTSCDRSKRGNGFPRYYNIQDHVKRVHEIYESDDNGNNTNATVTSGTTYVPSTKAARKASKQLKASLPNATVASGTTHVPLTKAARKALKQLKASLPAIQVKAIPLSTAPHLKDDIPPSQAPTANASAT